MRRMLHVRRARQPADGHHYRRFVTSAIRIHLHAAVRQSAQDELLGGKWHFEAMYMYLYLGVWWGSVAKLMIYNLTFAARSARRRARNFAEIELTGQAPISVKCISWY